MINQKSKHRRVHSCACPTCQEHPYSQVAAEHKAINRVVANLDEKNRRRFVGLLALQWGRRHILLISQVTGLSRMTIYRGQREIEHSDAKAHGRVRTPGAGRSPVEKNNLALLAR